MHLDIAQGLIITAALTGFMAFGLWSIWELWRVMENHDKYKRKYHKQLDKSDILARELSNEQYERSRAERNLQEAEKTIRMLKKQNDMLRKAAVKMESTYKNRAASAGTLTAQK